MKHLIFTAIILFISHNVEASISPHYSYRPSESRLRCLAEQGWITYTRSADFLIGEEIENASKIKMLSGRVAYAAKVKTYMGMSFKNQPPLTPRSAEQKFKELEAEYKQQQQNEVNNKRMQEERSARRTAQSMFNSEHAQVFLDAMKAHLDAKYPSTVQQQAAAASASAAQEKK